MILKMIINIIDIDQDLDSKKRVKYNTCYSLFLRICLDKCNRKQFKKIKFEDEILKVIVYIIEKERN